MFIGHYAVGFGSKRFAPSVSLAALLMAPLLLDLFWPIALLLGIESVKIDPGNTAVTPLDFHNYPYTHSLLMAIVWSFLYGGGYFAWRRDKRGASVLAFGVFSHWIMDFVTHRPDMPLYPASKTYVGLGLWNSFWATVIVEALIFALGIFLYVGTTRSKKRAGNISFWSMVAFVVLIYAGNLFGPTPTNVTAIAWGALSAWMVIPWAWWIDRTRESRAPAFA